MADRRKGRAGQLRADNDSRPARIEIVPSGIHSHIRLSARRLKGATLSGWSVDRLAIVIILLLQEEREGDETRRDRIWRFIRRNVTFSRVYKRREEEGCRPYYIGAN